MPFTHYRRMTAQQAAAALEEFLAERPAAWTRLSARLTASGVDPDTLLNASPESLTELWRWVTGHRAQLEGYAAPGVPVLPKEQWPSWARHAVTRARPPSETTVALVDGLVSYLAIVIISGAPNARWGLGSPQDPRHHLHHHPVLTGNGHQIFVPTMPMGGILRIQRREKSLHATELEQYARSAIADLCTGPTTVLDAGDAPVLVVAEPDGFDVGVNPAIAARGSLLVELMALELAGLDGIDSVLRRGPDALQVHAPTWYADDLERWLNDWMKAHGPFIR
jgi:hypothetical protein